MDPVVDSMMTMQLDLGEILLSYWMDLQLVLQSPLSS